MDIAHPIPHHIAEQLLACGEQFQRIFSSLLQMPDQPVTRRHWREWGLRPDKPPCNPSRSRHSPSLALGPCKVIAHSRNEALEPSAPSCQTRVADWYGEIGRLM